MKVYVAMQWWSDGGEAPDVHLYTKISDAADWLLYPQEMDEEEMDASLIEELRQELYKMGDPVTLTTSLTGCILLLEVL